MKKANKGGKAIKLSHELIGVLKKKQRKNESYDSILRRVLGMPKRSGEKQDLKIIYMLTRPEKIVFDRKADAVGEAMILAAMRKKRNAEKPIKFREHV